MKNFFYLWFCTFTLTGCGVTIHDKPPWAGVYLPTYTNNYQGTLFTEFSSDWRKTRPYMEMNCRDYGGLNVGSIRSTVPGDFWSQTNLPFGTYFFYACNGLKPDFSPTQPASNSAPQQSNRSESKPLENPRISQDLIEKAKVKCIELGFKMGTENFGNCVLKLSEKP